MERKRLFVPWYGFFVHPDNIPQRRAGVYLLRLRSTNACYVGASSNIHKRLRRHALRDRDFIAIPLIYVLDLDCLPELEETLADTYRAFDGFNRNRLFSRAAINGRAPHHTASNGAQRLARFMASIQSEQYKRRRAAGYAAQDRAAINAKISISNKTTMATPEFREWRSQTSKAIHTPEMKKRKGNSVRAAFTKPEVQARHRQGCAGRVAISNGAVRKWMKQSDTLPSGWKLGWS